MAVAQTPPIRAGADAPYGESAALARMASPAPARAPGPAQTPASAPSPPEQAQPPELNGGYDGALFGPTDRPQEPITHGAPFGPGANFVQTPQEDSRTFMLRVADELAATPELASYVDRIRAGG